MIGHDVHRSPGSGSTLQKTATDRSAARPSEPPWCARPSTLPQARDRGHEAGSARRGKVKFVQLATAMAQAAGHAGED